MAQIYTRSRLVFVVITIVLLLGAVLCGIVLPTASREAQDGGIHDFGLVFINNGPQELVAEFPLGISDNLSEVIDIFTTCGCLDARIETSEDVVGDPATLTMRMTLGAPGNRLETATVVFADGRRKDFSIRASGALRETLEVFVAKPPVGDRWEIEVLLLTYDQNPKPPNLTVDVSSGVSVSEIVWKTIHVSSDTTGHPSRFAGSVFVMSVESTSVVIKTESGLQARVKLTDA